jgi:hypothetical protein
MAEAEELSEAASALAVSVDPVPLPQGFEDGVIDKIRADRAPTLAPAPTPPRSRWRVLAPAVAAVAALAIIAVLGFSLLDARNDLSEERRLVDTLISADTKMQLDGPEGGAQMAATEDGGVFAAAGLDPAPEGHVYQLWLMDEECANATPQCRPVSAGTFTIEDGLATLELDRSPEGFVGAAVTIERGDGAAQPTTDPILSSL